MGSFKLSSLPLGLAMLSQQPLLASALAVNISSCSPSSLSIPPIFGTSVLSFSATPVYDYAAATRQNGDVPALQYTSLNFCNVTITYTHPGQNDILNTQIWLPLSKESWNGNFQGMGGGGWTTGSFEAVLPYPISEGYVAACTDGGHSASTPVQDWGLVSEGNVNLFLLQDFASVGLHDMTLFAKAVIEAYYGSPPTYSYWNGCSTGGRQGLMLAQRFPTDYDGILAIAPAINWDQFIVAEFWGQFLMNQAGVYPSNCEFAAITAQAIEACDGIDGVEDGVISAPGLCDFDATSLIGQQFICDGETEKNVFSEGATKIANQMWQGPQTEDGKSLWYGLTHDAALTALINTTCTSENETCTGQPFAISNNWIQIFIEKSLSFNTSTLTREQYTNLFAKAHDLYTSLIGTSNPDLSLFKATGGKMITWHGLADELIFPNGTTDYYSRVSEMDSNVRDFYRVFEAPGTEHCSAGAGPFPVDTLLDLTKWVEHDIAPETLSAKSVGDDGTVTERNLCVYPLVQRYVGGDVTSKESFVCAESF